MCLSTGLPSAEAEPETLADLSRGPPLLFPGRVCPEPVTRPEARVYHSNMCASSLGQVPRPFLAFSDAGIVRYYAEDASAPWCAFAARSEGSLSTMAYAAKHKLVTFYGTSWTDDSEEWQFSMRFGGGDATVTQTHADDVYTLAAAFAADTDLSMKSVHKFVGVKVAPIATTGLYPPGEIAYYKEGSPVAGYGTGGDPWPGQCTVCITLRTVIPRGRASRGRFYLPGLQGTISSYGKFPSGRPAAVAGACAAFIGDLNGVSGLGVAQVMSKTGEYSVVTDVECGDVVDTQRRRRRQLIEVRSSASV